MKSVTVNGITLHYEVAGEGRPVVMVHGNGEDHHLFDTEIDQLVKAGYKVYAPDSRGHGMNAPMPEYHYADMAEDMYQFICAMNLDKPAFYGFSDGGIIGLMMIIRHPDCLGALAISGTNLSPAGLIPSFIEEYTAINEEKKDPLITLMLTEPHIDPEDLRNIGVPVLVTAGENDLIRQSETELIANLIPQSTLIILQGEDHGSYVANSEIMGRLLIDFLNKRWIESIHDEEKKNDEKNLRVFCEKRIDDLLAKPCWIVDIFPEQVPGESPGQFFAVEKYYLQDPSLRQKQQNIILILNCYYDLILVTDGEEIRNPLPTVWMKRLGQEYLNILAGEHTLITVDQTDTHMTVFSADERILAMIRNLAEAEGLFMWKGND